MQESGGARSKKATCAYSLLQQNEQRGNAQAFSYDSRSFGGADNNLQCAVSDIETLAELSENENIIGIKEASGNISYAVRAARLISDDFFMMSGCDDITVPLMSVGASGVISVASNIVPRKVSSMTKAFLSGDTNKARKIQLELLPLISALFCEVNPIPVKTAMNLMGMNVGGLRLPLFEMSERGGKILKEAMRKEKLI